MARWDAGIPYVGAGRDLAAAQAPVYLQAGRLTVAYVAASRAEKFCMTPEATDTTPGILLCYDNNRFIASIREAAAHADYVVAFPHWGIERSTDLQDEQTQGARAYIDAGADAVIGTHAHCMQGIEFYQGKPILYNLGNFWFDGFKGLTALAELQLPLTASESGRDECAGQDGRAGRDGHGEQGERFERSGLDVRARQGVRVEQDERDRQGRRGVDPSGVRLVLYPGWRQMAITSWIDAPADRANAFRYIEDISVNATIDEAGFGSEA